MKTIWRVIETRTEANGTARNKVLRNAEDEEKARRIAAARRTANRARGYENRTVRIEKTETGGAYE